MPKRNKFYPIIDLFAGPGGLGEGFATLTSTSGDPVFRSVVSIERDEHAHQTLTLRHFFRQFDAEDVPDAYYAYVAGEISRDQLIDWYPTAWAHAKASSLRISLGEEQHDNVQKLISHQLGKTTRWALIGGPPCQAYSLVGRSRMMGSPAFESDERHFLYREYLKIITDHRPPVFVMENVKGLLSSKVAGELVIHRILSDLSCPKRAVRGTENGLMYRLYGLSNSCTFSNGLDPKDFLVRAEEFGVPQARHRMFIVGIRNDIDVTPATLSPSEPPTVHDVIGSLPKIRSGVSRTKDSFELWRSILKESEDAIWFEQVAGFGDETLKTLLARTIERIDSSPKRIRSRTYKAPTTMSDWYYDERLRGLQSHEARSHMPSDLQRYLFAATYAMAHAVSPKLKDFPSGLLPEHQSARRSKNIGMFEDRFRVQLSGRVSTTITSHISKDGHYFIHYDPQQCRSLTVREAARLQTFPDNYHFEGPRTAQYHQIGNAVPPYLARQIAEIVKEILDALPED